MRRVLTICILSLFLIGVAAGLFTGIPAAHASSTVTVTNTPTGVTSQTQLSTNIVTWASDFTQIPNGQTSLNNLHAPLVRLHLGDDGGPAMPEIDQGNWDMTTINTMVNDAYASNQQPLMNIKYAPDWQWTCYPNSVGKTGNQTSGTIADTTFAPFAQYMARLVNYYNKGSLTEENGTVLLNPAGTSHKITYWELWNEPDLDIETPCSTPSGQGISADQYTTMWNAVTSAMLAVDSSLKFVGPATAGYQAGDGPSQDPYADNIMGSGTTVKPFALSTHAYGYYDAEPDIVYFDGSAPGPGNGGIPDLVTQVQNYATAYPNTPIWLTEVNVNADMGATQTNDEMGVAWWGATLQQVAPYASHLTLINQFDLTASYEMGLIDGEGININGGTNPPTGNLMLSYYLMQQLKTAFPPGSTLLQSSSGQNGILSLAAKRPDGSYSVMIINRTVPNNTVQSTCGNGGSPENITVDLTALSPTAITNTQLDKNTVNCSTEFGIAPTAQNLATGQPTSLSFPGYGVAFLHIT